MWAYLSSWVIEDEQLPALAVGDETGCVGLRVDARELVTARGADAIAALDDPGDDTVASAATGVVRSTVDDYNGFTDVAAVEFVLDLGNLQVLARVPRGARQPQAGERVTARGRLTVIPPHEFDDFALPDVRSAMRIDAIQVEHRRPVSRTDGSHEPGPVLGRQNLERLSRWERLRLERPGEWIDYMLDLRVTVS